MLKIHSASDGMISYIQNYAKEHDKRKKNRLNTFELQQRIVDLEKKLAEYEKRKAESLCKVLDILSPPSERIKLIPIYKRLNFSG